MKKVLTNYRYYLLMILGVVAILGTFAVPTDDLTLGVYAWVLFTTKAVGFTAFWIISRLVKHWEAKNVIPEFTNFCNEF